MLTAKNYEEWALVGSSAGGSMSKKTESLSSVVGNYLILSKIEKKF